MRMIVIILVGFAVLALLALYFPVAVVRQFLAPDDEPAPAWMGDARGRKRRLAAILTGFLVAGLALLIYALLQG